MRAMVKESLGGHVQTHTAVGGVYLSPGGMQFTHIQTPAWHSSSGLASFEATSRLVGDESVLDGIDRVADDLVADFGHDVLRARGLRRCRFCQICRVALAVQAIPFAAVVVSLSVLP